MATKKSKGQGKEMEAISDKSGKTWNNSQLETAAKLSRGIKPVLKIRSYVFEVSFIQFVPALRKSRKPIIFFGELSRFFWF